MGNAGVGVQGPLLYRLPRMLYILLPESRQAASRSLDSTSSSVESCKQIHLYVQTCICCYCCTPTLPTPRPPIPDLSLRCLCCVSLAVIHVLNQFFKFLRPQPAPTATERQTEKGRERRTEVGKKQT